MCKTTIIKVQSEFDDIYRITTENGLVLDISEKKSPAIGSSFEYYLDNEDKEDKNYITMNGQIFGITENGILVSFGGLLGNIPCNDKDKDKLYITLHYLI